MMDVISVCREVDFSCLGSALIEYGGHVRQSGRDVGHLGRHVRPHAAGYIDDENRIESAAGHWRPWLDGDQAIAVQSYARIVVASVGVLKSGRSRHTNGSAIGHRFIRRWRGRGGNHDRAHGSAGTYRAAA